MIDCGRLLATRLTDLSADLVLGSLGVTLSLGSLVLGVSLGPARSERVGSSQGGPSQLGPPRSDLLLLRSRLLELGLAEHAANHLLGAPDRAGHGRVGLLVTVTTSKGQREIVPDRALVRQPISPPLRARTTCNAQRQPISFSPTPEF